MAILERSRRPYFIFEMIIIVIQEASGEKEFHYSDKARTLNYYIMIVREDAHLYRQKEHEFELQTSLKQYSML